MLGNETLSNSMIYNWFREFRAGRKSLSDDVREGRTKSAVTHEHNDAVRKQIASDRSVTYHKIETSLNILSNSFNFK